MIKIICNHDNGIAPFKDWSDVHLGWWCYKCHKTWFEHKKGEIPNEREVKK